MLIKKSPELATRQDGSARILGLSKKDVMDAMDAYSTILFSRTAFDREALKNNRFGRRELWNFGISGELPVVAVSVNDEEEAKKSGRLDQKNTSFVS